MKITLYVYEIRTNGGKPITVRSLRQLTEYMLKRKAEERGLDFFIENAVCMD